MRFKTVFLGVVILSITIYLIDLGLSFPENAVSQKTTEVLSPDSKEYINLYSPKWLSVKNLESDYYSYQDDAFIAKVISYGDPESYTNDKNIRWLQIQWKYKNDNGTIETGTDAIELSLVTPRVLSECGGQFASKLSKTPREVLEEILPIGSRILAIRETPKSWGTEFFVHLLPFGGSTANFMPPNNSVNEMLVETGTWVPFNGWMHNIPYEGSDIYVARGGEVREYDKKFSIEGIEFLSVGYTAKYLSLIIDAGNQALLGTTPGQQCTESFERLLAYEIEVQKEDDEEYRRWLIERESWENSYCIDGDGDGICYED
jgi:hypothetical protein